MYCLFCQNNIFNNVNLWSYAVEGDMFMSCIRPCSETYDDDSCYNDCIQNNKGAGFCYLKLPNISNEKDCCCNNWPGKKMYYILVSP